MVTYGRQHGSQLTGNIKNRLQSKNICRKRWFLLINRREVPHFSMKLSSVLGKKWGILIKKESKSLEFTGLKIPRDYYLLWRFRVWSI